MQQFDLSVWLQDKSRKVVTRDGSNARIICTDRKISDSTNVIALVKNSHDIEKILVCNTDGRDVYGIHQNDLFFADEEELTEFEKEVAEAYEWAKTTEREDFIKEFSPKLLDIARKEIEKENSEFKPKFTYNEKDYSKLANKLIEFRNNTPLCSVSYRDGKGRKVILHYEKEIRDLVRNEIEKTNP